MAKDWTQIKLIANAVAINPGQTGAELSASIHQPGAYRRLSEVKRLGLVKKGPRRKCAVSGKLADTWLPDDSTPEPDRGAERPRDAIKRLQGRVDFLVNENTNLRTHLERMVDMVKFLGLQGPPEFAEKAERTIQEAQKILK